LLIVNQCNVNSRNIYISPIRIVTMRKITVIPTMKRAFSCVIHHPTVVVPFTVFFLVIGLIIVYTFSRFFELFDMVASAEEAPFAVMGGIFGFFAFIFLIILFVFFTFPFFEGWTFAAAASAFKNESVSIVDAARKALSKYIGLVVITFIMVLAWLVVGSILSIIISVVIFAMTASFTPIPSEYSPAPSITQFYGMAVMYGIMIVIMVAFMVIFIYMKPAYIVSGKRFSESLGDGFDTTKKNFLPSFLIVLFFVLVPFLVNGVLWAVLTVGGVLDFEELLYPDFAEVTSLFPVLIVVGAVLVIVNVVFYAAFYAAVTYSYMDSHEMVS